MQIYFHRQLFSHLSRVPILVEGTVCVLNWVVLYLKDSSCSFLLKEFAKKLCKFLTDFYAAERLTRGFLWCDLFFFAENSWCFPTWEAIIQTILHQSWLNILASAKRPL